MACTIKHLMLATALLKKPPRFLKDAVLIIISHRYKWWEKETLNCLRQKAELSSLEQTASLFMNMFVGIMKIPTIATQWGQSRRNLMKHGWQMFVLPLPWKSWKILERNAKLQTTISTTVFLIFSEEVKRQIISLLKKWLEEETQNSIALRTEPALREQTVAALFLKIFAGSVKIQTTASCWGQLRRCPVKYALETSVAHLP